METHLPPQPAPDAPAPPPGPEAIRSRRKMGTILLGIFLSITLLLVIAVPVAIKQIKAADRTHALSNLKQLNLSLIDFDNDYGRFPNDTTIPSVNASTRTAILLGTKTSNDYFRQLIATGNSESFFWAKTATTPRKPDGNTTGAHALEKGECSYSYIAGLSTNENPATPLAMAPLITGTWTFDPQPYDNFAVLLRVDGSVSVVRLHPHGEARNAGKNFFDPAALHWSGKAPDLKWPE